MGFFRPKSFLSLVLVGFALVLLPLVLALFNAERSMGQLARQSAQAVYRSVGTTQGSRILVEDITALERRARLYEVLGEEHLWEEMKAKHSLVQETLKRLLALPLGAEQIGRLQELQSTESKLFSLLENEPRGTAERESALAMFDKLNTLSNAIYAESKELIFREVDAMQVAAEKAQKALVWQAVGLVPFSILFVALFTHLISRPIQDVVAAINRLGEGDFVTPVTVHGPGDLVFMGQRLDWMRTQLADVDRAKSKFVAQVSHELKTPLASIREGADLMAEEVVGPLNAPQKEIADILCKSGKDLHKLIENLLGFSRVQAGMAPSLHLEAVMLCHLVEEVLVDHKPLMMKKGIGLDLHLEPLIVQGDREKLRTVIDNLISNAAKFTPEEGRIGVDIRKEGDTIYLQVADTGPGVMPEERQRVFEPFYQGSVLAEGHVKGTGLGLSIAREFALEHRGSLELEAAESGGTRIRLNLPAKQPTDT